MLNQPVAEFVRIPRCVRILTNPATCCCFCHPFRMSFFFGSVTGGAPVGDRRLLSDILSGLIKLSSAWYTHAHDFALNPKTHLHWSLWTSNRPASVTQIELLLAAIRLLKCYRFLSQPSRSSRVPADHKLPLKSSNDRLLLVGQILSAIDGQHGILHRPDLRSGKWKQAR